MNFKNLLENKRLLEVLHQTLERTDTLNKISNVSLKGERYAYNQYSLLIIMDFIIKYQIIINNKIFNDFLINELSIITKKYKNHQDLVVSLNNLLIDITAKKLNLLNKEDIHNQVQIIKYIYDRYIVNGYCFYSFSSTLKDKIEQKGIELKIDYKELSFIKQINHIFNNHNYKNITSIDLNRKMQPIYITDSPAMAYYYAMIYPNYLNVITSMSKYYDNISEDYDKEAFLRKDYNTCKSNLSSLCSHLNMTNREITTILKAFSKRWKDLDITVSKPCIAFIKRKDLAKDSLSNIDKIVENIGKEPLSLTVSRITDSKYPLIRRYSDIDTLSFITITMPSYKEIKDYQNLEKPKVENIKSGEALQEEYVVSFDKLNYSYGYASLVALLGLLLISLGLTVGIILKVIGG